MDSSSALRCPRPSHLRPLVASVSVCHRQSPLGEQRQEGPGLGLLHTADVTVTRAGSAGPRPATFPRHSEPHTSSPVHVAVGDGAQRSVGSRAGSAELSLCRKQSLACLGVCRRRPATILSPWWERKQSSGPAVRRQALRRACSQVWLHTPRGTSARRHVPQFPHPHTGAGNVWLPGLVGRAPTQGACSWAPHRVSAYSDCHGFKDSYFMVFFTLFDFFNSRGINFTMSCPKYLSLMKSVSSCGW